MFEGALCDGRRVAVKRSLLPEAQRAAALEAFQGEANTMMGAAHPNLLPLVGMCIEGQHLCLVTPLMAGGSLYGRLFPGMRAAAGLNAAAAAAPPLPPLRAGERVDVLILLARALTYLHGLPEPVVHRDVKSLNVLLDDERGAHLPPFRLKSLAMHFKYAAPVYKHAFGHHFRICVTELRDVHALTQI